MSDRPLVLKELEIRANNRWNLGSEPPDFYVATVEFTDGCNEIKTTLDADLSAKILDLIADRLVVTAKTAAAAITAKTITAASPAQLESDDFEEDPGYVDTVLVE